MLSMQLRILSFCLHPHSLWLVNLLGLSMGSFELSEVKLLNFSGTHC